MAFHNCRLSSYLNVGGLREGPGKMVLEKSWNFLSLKVWEPWFYEAQVCVMWHKGNGHRGDARDGGGKKPRTADTDNRQVTRERREVERKRRFVISTVIIVVIVSVLCNWPIFGPRRRVQKSHSSCSCSSCCCYQFSKNP